MTTNGIASRQRGVAVCGATGRQGGAVARRLLKEGWRVCALTRHPNGHEARALAQLGAEVFRADLLDAQSLIDATKGMHGVFGVTDFWEHGFDGEVQMGTNPIDAAMKNSVEHFVFSSVGATERTAGLGITHFDSKAVIEENLRQSGLDWTILRPVTFMENFITHRYRKAICERGLLRFAFDLDHSFQMVAMDDLAVFAAKAFDGDARIKGQATEVASDAFTMEEWAAALGEHLGRPVKYKVIGKPALHAVDVFVTLTRSQGYFKVGHSLINQFAWNNGTEVGGWNADIARLRRIHPDLMTLEKWIRAIDWRAGL